MPFFFYFVSTLSNTISMKLVTTITFLTFLTYLKCFIFVYFRLSIVFILLPVRHESLFCQYHLLSILSVCCAQVSYLFELNNFMKSFERDDSLRFIIAPSQFHTENIVLQFPVVDSGNMIMSQHSLCILIRSLTIIHLFHLILVSGDICSLCI